MVIRVCEYSFYIKKKFFNEIIANATYTYNSRMDNLWFLVHFCSVCEVNMCDSKG